MLRTSADDAWQAVGSREWSIESPIKGSGQVRSAHAVERNVALNVSRLKAAAHIVAKSVEEKCPSWAIRLLNE